MRERERERYTCKGRKSIMVKSVIQRKEEFVWIGREFFERETG